MIYQDNDFNGPSRLRGQNWWHTKNLSRYKTLKEKIT